MGTVHIDSPPIVWKCDARVYHTKTKFTIFWQPCIKNRTQAGKIPPVCMPWLKPRAGGSQKILTVSLVIYFPALCKPIKINKTSLNCGPVVGVLTFHAEGCLRYFTLSGTYQISFFNPEISFLWAQWAEKAVLDCLLVVHWHRLSVVPLAMKNPFVKWLINQEWAGKPLPFFF